MTADRDKLRFYVDESALGLGKTLALARKDVIHAGHPLIPECGVGALDTEWIPAAAKRGLIVIARDKHIRTRPQEVRVLRDAGLRVFLIGGKKDASTWDWLTRMVRRWEGIERTIRSEGAGPWCWVVNESALSKLDFPPT